MTTSLNKLDSSQLLTATQNAIKEERRLGIEVLKHLREIEARELHLARGYPSLFEMCTTEFGYSAGAAHRRIAAMRLIRDIPEVAHKIETGRVSLSTAASIQSFLRNESRTSQTYSKTQKIELIESCENKSTREVERELAHRNPSFAKREVLRETGQGAARLTLSISNELRSKLDRLQEALSHKNPTGKYESLIDAIADIALEKVDRARCPTRSTLKSSDLLPAPEVGLRSRAIPARVRREVLHQNTNLGCSFTDPTTNRRCGSRAFNQLDHIQAFSLGGANEVENLRVLCAGHNRFVFRTEQRNSKPVHD